MVERIVVGAVAFICAVSFFGLGVYAKRRKEPMFFWSGTEVSAYTIKDVKKYNKANGIMWQLHSLWYVASCIAQVWNSKLALILLVLGCTIGLFSLIFIYEKIYKKYKIN